jgi:ribosomal protein S18 acetylase RimI-like enzyme
MLPAGSNEGRRGVSATEVEIRRLGDADVADYREIRLAALEDEPESFGAVHAIEASRPLSFFAERLASSLVVGAYNGALIVGMVGCKQEEATKKSHKGFIWGFYVRPEWRRRGVGSALVAELIHAAGQVVEQLTLAVVAQNVAAISLYTRFGFAVYGVEPRSLKGAEGYSDEVLMALRLRWPHRPLTSACPATTDL